MGLIVPEEAKQYFWNARVGQKPPAGYGTQAGKPQYGPNAVFKKLRIPLKMTWSLIHKFKTIDQFRAYLAQVETSNKDILVCYDWPALFDSTEEKHWGHVCVLDRVFLEKNTVRLIDPAPDAPKWREILIPDLYRAMVAHGKSKSGGFWELQKI